MRRRRGRISIFRENERPLDMYRMQYLRNSFYALEAAQIATRQIQARVFCENFDVKVKGFGVTEKTTSRETKMVIEEYWMQSMPEIHAHIIQFELCPYIMQKLPRSDHVYPKVPEWGTYFITYEPSFDDTIFRLYRTDKMPPEEVKNVLWVKGVNYPQNGEFRSVMATIDQHFSLQMANLAASMKAMRDAADPMLVFETKPSNNQDLADYLATEEAFGRSEVFRQMGNRQQLYAMQSALKKEHMQSSAVVPAGPSMGFDSPTYLGFEQFDGSMAAAYNDTYKKFMSRSIVLEPDYVIRPTPQARILMNMQEIWTKVSRDIASLIGFPLEFAQPMSKTTAGNVVGESRFLNESVKKLRKDFRRIVRRMWLISYGQLLVKKVDDEKRRIRRNPSAAKEFELNSQIEVEIEWPCVPEQTYDLLRTLVDDEVLDHSAMACQAAGLLGMPLSIINCKGGKLPEQRARELQEKQFKLQEDYQKAQLEMQKQQLKQQERLARKRERDGGELQEETPNKKIALKPPKGKGKVLSVKKKKIPTIEDDIKRVRGASRRANK